MSLMFARTLFFLTFAAAPALVAQTTALTHVNVVDVTTGVIARDQTVVITQGRISAVGPAATITVPRGAVTSEQRNRFVIPGLWDIDKSSSEIAHDASRPTVTCCVPVKCRWAIGVCALPRKWCHRRPRHGQRPHTDTRVAG